MEDAHLLCTATADVSISLNLIVLVAEDMPKSKVYEGNTATADSDESHGVHTGSSVAIGKLEAQRVISSALTPNIPVKHRTRCICTDSDIASMSHLGRFDTRGMTLTTPTATAVL